MTLEKLEKFGGRKMKKFTVIVINEKTAYDEVRHVVASSEQEIANGIESGYLFVAAFED